MHVCAGVAKPSEKLNPHGWTIDRPAIGLSMS